MNDFIFLCTPPDSEPTLRDAFPDFGLFEALADNGTMPWSVDNIDNDTLDLEYFGNRSGAKFCSPLVKLLLSDDGTLTNANINRIAKVIVAKYLRPWQRLWATFEVEYNPIENYNMEERTSRQQANSESQINSEDVSHTGTDTIAYGKIETVESDSTDDSTDGVYGFNSTDSNPSDTSSSTGHRESTTAQSGSDVDTKNLVDSTEGRKDSIAAEDEVIDRVRRGNIGVTTNQAMIEAERKLWRWNFFDHIFRDLDKELTLAFFDTCRV